MKYILMFYIKYIDFNRDSINLLYKKYNYNTLYHLNKKITFQKR